VVRIHHFPPIDEIRNLAILPAKGITMFKVTYIKWGKWGPEIATITHPNESVAKTVHDALVMAGIHVRLWTSKNKLMKPPRRTIQKRIQQEMLKIGWD
jgi:hypothetical protein